MIRDLARAFIEWIDNDPFSLAIGADGLACLVALVYLLVFG